MAIGRISGPMLRANLDRLGVDLSFETDLLYLDVNNSRIGINNDAPTVGLEIGGTDGIVIPAGSSAQRPGTLTAGLIRFNTDTTTFEFYDGSGWNSVGGDITTIVSDSFSGDGSTTDFTLSENSTTAGTLVSVNGILQDPADAYTVSGTTLSFSEAPADGYAIDARVLTMTTTVVSLYDGNTSFVLDDSSELATVTINGTDVTEVSGSALQPAADNTFTIGTVSRRWSTVYAVNTTVQNADLAEMYAASLEIPAGTVVEFGGDDEIQISQTTKSTRVAGVVSTKPGYLMNDKLGGPHPTPVALQGRVPCKVIGKVRKGDMMVSAGNGRAKADANPTIGSVIGKALKDFDGDLGTIEIVVGRL